MEINEEILAQRRYYAETAENYDNMHVLGSKEHTFALAFLSGMVELIGAKSMLDVGSGTGRVLQFFKDCQPELKVVGVEPVAELREVGYSKGLSKEQLIDGDATNLCFPDGSFDFVVEFGVLHHLREPTYAVSEMLRVANKAIFISDCNNFGQGSALERGLKQILRTLGLWELAYRIKTKGKGYSVSEGDGVAYSYSVFDSYQQIRSGCHTIHVVNTQGQGVNPYRTASHVALLGIKKPREKIS